MKSGEVSISVDNSAIKGDLHIISHASSLVIFAHGSGSSRLSSRNRFVAEILHKANISTLLFDLLTPEEEAVDQYTRQFRFDIPLLASRLAAVTRWIVDRTDAIPLKLGYFGASTGAGAALIAATHFPGQILAIVSRGGRPDLAGKYLGAVQAATLLIVGELDEEVIKLNEDAFAQLSCTKEIYIVPGATHLFEEKGTLEIAAQAAQQWFVQFLT